MWSSNAHPQTTGAPEPRFESSMCFPWMSSASWSELSKVHMQNSFSLELFSWGLMINQEQLVSCYRPEHWSTVQDSPGACTIPLKDFSLCQGI